MTPLRIAICDDEAFMRRQLAEQVGGFLRQAGVAAEMKLFAAADALLRELPGW